MRGQKFFFSLLQSVLELAMIINAFQFTRVLSGCFTSALLGLSLLLQMRLVCILVRERAFIAAKYSRCSSSTSSCDYSDSNSTEQLVDGRQKACEWRRAEPRIPIEVHHVVLDVTRCYIIR